MKYTLTLKPFNGTPFSCLPARSIELNADQILCNDITLPSDFNPHNTRLFVIGNEYGALGAVWASCEQDAFDTLLDEGLGQSFLLEESDIDSEDEVTRLGNAGEPCNLDHAWMQEVDLSCTVQNIPLLLMFAEAKGARVANLDKI